MARSHVDLFSGLEVDAVVVACGTCGESFKKKYVNLLNGTPGYAKRPGNWRQKHTISPNLSVTSSPLTGSCLRKWSMKVTYHEPCHLGRGLGVTREPLEIIGAVPGLDFVPLQKPDWCCGNAGTFNLTHYDVSYNILKHKLADIAGTGAEAVITGCSACRMQLEEGSPGKAWGKKVLHTAELLAMSLK